MLDAVRDEAERLDEVINSEVSVIESFEAIEEASEAAEDYRDAVNGYLEGDSSQLHLESEFYRASVEAVNLSSAYNQLVAIQESISDDWDRNKERAVRSYEKVADNVEFEGEQVLEVYNDVLDEVEAQVTDAFQKMSQGVPDSELNGYETPEIKQLYKVLGKYAEKDSVNPLDLAGLNSSQLGLFEVHHALDFSPADTEDVSWLKDDEFVEIEID